jgi:A/G-specific adenine glycosylase
VTDREIREFRTRIADWYKDNRRDFPWRETSDPYRITVSEIMLQQTQTGRVLKKYPPFIKRFPDFESLSRSSLREVLLLWQGLGYNRRGRALREIAFAVTVKYMGILPSVPEELEKLPMIGPATAGSIAAFAFNRPAVFIETNIRRVFIHCFYPDAENVNDRDILSLVEETLDTKNPREWYYALMDYGVMLKNKYPNPNKKSAHYTLQPPFENSNRQIRGRIIALMAENEEMGFARIIDNLEIGSDRIDKCLAELEKEGFLSCENGVYKIKEG